MNPWWIGPAFAAGFVIGIPAAARYNRWSTARWRDASRRLGEAMQGGGGHFATDLVKQTGLRWKYVYVLLIRLEREGVIVSRWIGETYPRRRQYRLAGKPEEPS